MLKHFKKLDWTLIAVIFLLVSIGIVFIYSASLGRGDFSNLQKQLFFVVAGTILMFFMTFFDWRVFKVDTFFILALYFISIILLIGLFFFAPEIRGVKSWYKIGPFSFDPIELAKIVLIILLAKYFSMRHVEMYRVSHILISGIYVLIPCLLIFFQPDLGSVLIFVSFWLGMLIVSGIKLRHFLILVLIGILISVFGWSTILKDYQKERLLSFLQPHLADPLDVGWSQRQAKIAIGAGGIFGQGIGSGSQTQYGFLSEPQTDFIFSVIVEETGLMGAFIMLFLLSILFWRIFKIATESTYNFPRLFAVGLGVFLFVQTFVHVGMNIGFLPIIGIPLPFVSYGGSSLISIFIGLGILQSFKVGRA
jgi:rod shape determining protein RodA